MNNQANRCYLCKRIEFKKIIEPTERYGICHVLDGSNIDDESDYRPGMSALEELKIISPLRKAGFIL
jgi:PP-loop superfamily ATP-utilizing enzyme